MLEKPALPYLARIIEPYIIIWKNASSGSGTYFIELTGTALR